MRPMYCDESIRIPVADGLRRREWTVRTARDEELLHGGGEYATRSALAHAERRLPAVEGRTNPSTRLSNRGWANRNR